MTLQIHEVLERLLNASACFIAHKLALVNSASVLFVLYEEFNMITSSKLILSHPTTKMVPASHHATIAETLHEVVFWEQSVHCALVGMDPPISSYYQ